MTSVGPVVLFEWARTSACGILGERAREVSATGARGPVGRERCRANDAQAVVEHLEAVELCAQRVRVAPGRAAGVDLARELEHVGPAGGLESGRVGDADRREGDRRREQAVLWRELVEGRRVGGAGG